MLPGREALGKKVLRKIRISESHDEVVNFAKLERLRLCFVFPLR